MLLSTTVRVAMQTSIGTGVRVLLVQFVQRVLTKLPRAIHYQVRIKIEHVLRTHARVLMVMLQQEQAVHQILQNVPLAIIITI